MAGLHKHYIDFDILDLDNPKTIVFLDLSDYFEDPERPLLEITPPGYTKYFLANIDFKSKINTLNSNLIGMSKVLNSSELLDLPDGVWTFKYKICPYDKLFKQKYILRSLVLERNLDTILSNLEFSDCDIKSDKKIQKEVIDILLLLEAAKANAKKGNASKASTLYQKANSNVNSLLNKLTETC